MCVCVYDGNIYNDDGELKQPNNIQNDSKYKLNIFLVVIKI